MSHPIEYRQVFARMYAVKVRHGKLFTERAAEVLQSGDYPEAMADLEIARSFFPDNEKLTQLIRLVKTKMQRGNRAAPTKAAGTLQPPSGSLSPGGLPAPAPHSGLPAPHHAGMSSGLPAPMQQSSAVGQPNAAVAASLPQPPPVRTPSDPNRPRRQRSGGFKPQRPPLPED